MEPQFLGSAFIELSTLLRALAVVAVAPTILFLVVAVNAPIYFFFGKLMDWLPDWFLGSLGFLSFFGTVVYYYFFGGDQ